MQDTENKNFLTIQESFDYLVKKIVVNRERIDTLTTSHIYTEKDIEDFLVVNHYIDVIQGDLRYQQKGNYYTVQDINDNYYSKTEIDFMLYGGTASSPFANYYTKSEVDAKIPSLPDPDFPDIFGTRGEEYIGGFNDDQDESITTTVAGTFGQLVLTDTKIITNQTSFNNNELVTKLYVDTRENFGNVNGTEDDGKGKIIHGNKSVTFEELIKVVKDNFVEKIVFLATDRLQTDTNTHKISIGRDIPDLTINQNYKYISDSKTGTKYDISNLTTTEITIRNISNGNAQSGYSFQYIIRKNALNNNVQFRYDYANTAGNITIPTTITLYLFLE